MLVFMYIYIYIYIYMYIYTHISNCAARKSATALSYQGSRSSFAGRGRKDYEDLTVSFQCCSGGVWCFLEALEGFRNYDKRISSMQIMW